MSRTWKWIIGIGLSVSILALAVLPFVMRIGMHAVPFIKQGMRAGRQFPGRMQDFGLMGGAPGMMGFTNILLPILVIVFVLFIGYLVGSSRKPTTLAPAASVPVATPVELKPCTQCGKGLENNWAHCPYCGKQISDQ